MAVSHVLLRQVLEEVFDLSDEHIQYLRFEHVSNLKHQKGEEDVNEYFNEELWPLSLVLLRGGQRVGTSHVI